MIPNLESSRIANDAAVSPVGESIAARVEAKLYRRQNFGITKNH